MCKATQCIWRDYKKRWEEAHEKQTSVQEELNSRSRIEEEEVSSVPVIDR